MSLIFRATPLNFLPHYPCLSHPFLLSSNTNSRSFCILSTIPRTYIYYRHNQRLNPKTYQTFSMTVSTPSNHWFSLLLLSNLPPSNIRDALSLTTSTFIAVALVLVVGRLRSAHLLGSVAARKIMHILSAPLWILSWCFYANDSTSRFYAAALPLCFLGCVIFDVGGLSRMVGRERNRVLNGNGNGHRNGNDKGEGMEGVAWYLVVMILVALFGWRKEAAGIVAVSMMSFGDGIAEVVGRKLGVWGRWWGEKGKGKSFAGTAAFIVGGWLGSMGLVRGLELLGTEGLDGWNDWNGALRQGIVATVCAVVELVPGINDNIAVPVVAALLTKLLH